MIDNETRRRRSRKAFWPFARLVGSIAMIVMSLAGATALAEDPILMVRNGGWCWFQGERAVCVDRQVIFTSIAGAADYGPWGVGDLVATQFDTSSHQLQHFLLHAKFQQDDHAVAGLCPLEDGRILAVYGKHGSDALQRWRISRHPGSIQAWSQEQHLKVGASYTYSNVYRLPAENGRLLNFHRGLGYNPNCSVSDDEGVSWQYGWRLLNWSREDLRGDPRFTEIDGGRPYVRYASNRRDTIHFLLTDDHPRAYDNSLYHGYYRSGQVFDSTGKALLPPRKPDHFTEIFAGDADHVAWPSDIRLDADGNPAVAFSVQVNDAAHRGIRSRGGQTHHYHYARWNGSEWDVNFVGFAGTRLYAAEEDYTGLVSIDPSNVNRIVISSNSHPVTGQPLLSASDGQRHWEIFMGTTDNRGKTWQWQAVTRNSTQDNLRPILVSIDADQTLLLWCRGQLTTYSNYRLDIVGLFR